MVEIKRIDDREKRNSAFHKRSEGLLKKARKLSIMCDADVGVVIFSYSGNLKEYVSSPRVFERYNNKKKLSGPSTVNMGTSSSQSKKISDLERDLAAYKATSSSQRNKISELERELASYKTDPALSEIRGG